MRTLIVSIALALASAHAAAASNVSVSIGINVPTYPVLQRVPGYPVYYAPSLNTNYFFYDGMYWVFDGREWYMSAWYNGPWQLVDRYEVPVYVLRVPVRYYRARPTYFSSWAVDAPPRWDAHWGATWSERRAGWDRWSRSSVPAAAPLPTYQRAYSGTRYPQFDEQITLQSQRYTYRPRDTVVRERYEQLRAQAPGQARKEARSAERQQARVERDQRIAEQRVAAQRFDSVREERRGRVDNAPPPHAQAKGWPGKGHERGDDHPGRAKGHDKDRDGVDDPPGRGKGRGHDR